MIIRKMMIVSEPQNQTINRLIFRSLMIIINQQKVKKRVTCSDLCVFKAQTN